MSLMPLPRSKSQIFTGDTWAGLERAVRAGSWGPGPKGRPPPSVPLTWLGCSQRMFSGFRSLWAMPAGRTKNHQRWSRVGGHVFQESWADGLGARVDPWGRRPGHPPLLCRKSRALATSCTTTLASSSLKCRRLCMWLRMEPGPEYTGVTSTAQRPAPTPPWQGSPHSGLFESKVLQPELGPPPWTPKVPLMGRPPGSFSLVALSP